MVIERTTRSLGRVVLEVVAVCGSYSVATAVVYFVGASIGWPVAVAAVAVGALPFLHRHLPAEQRLAAVARSQALVPGVLVATLCALMVPVRPFRHAAWVVAEALAPTVVWWLSGLVREWLGSRAYLQGDGVSSSGARWLSVVAVAVITAVVVLALGRGWSRPTSDDYWAALAPMRVDSAGSTPSRSCEGVKEPCAYTVEDGTCLVVDPVQEWCFVECPGDVCPRIAVRIDARTRKSALSREETSRTPSPRHVNVTGYTRQGGKQGRRLTALAIGGEVRLPAEWIGLAVAAVALVIAGVVGRRLKSRGGDSAAMRIQEEALSRRWSDALFWRSAAVGLLACGGPLVVAAVLGVGV
jgi:hypothetical protein